MTSRRIRFFVHSSTAEDERSNNRWFPYGNAEDFDTNLAMILVILVCSLAGVLALNACIRCYMRRHAEADDAAAAGGRLPETEVAKKSSRASVPTLVYSAGMKLAGAESECAICLSEFVNGERVRVLPKCNHGFHEKCIEGWLVSKPSCPTCRRSCLSPDRDITRGNETVTPAPPEAMAEP